MHTQNKKNQVLALLERYDVSTLYTNQKEPIWTDNTKIQGIATSYNFNRINSFAHFISELEAISSSFNIKPIAPDLYHGDYNDIRQAAAEDDLICCYTYEQGWLY